MFDKAMKKSVEPYLEPGEELLNLTIVQGKGMTRALVGGGVAGQAIVGAMRDRKAKAAEAEGGADPDAIKLANKMGLALTSRRLLAFKAGGAMALKAQELLSDVPISDVDSIEVGKGAITKPVTVTVRGESFQVEAPKVANMDKLVAAYEQARQAPTA
jgi:hypothetical protein